MTKLVFIDTETTGLDPVENQILTIGIVIDQSGRIVKEREIKIKYKGGNVSKQALEVNGIDLESHNEAALEPSHALTELNRELRGLGFKRYVAHNVAFDKPMIQAEYLRARVHDESYLIRSNWLCTKDLASWLCLHGILNTPGGSVRLDACLKTLGLEDRGDDAHGALNDARLAREIYYRMRNVAGWQIR